MINKSFKTIHKNYLPIFKFIFFLRYLIAIFLISILLFLIIPKFFDYDKKSYILENYLVKNYNLKINQYEQINFHIFPFPNIEIKKAQSELNQINSNLFIDSLTLYPKLFSIYNFEKFEVKKIALNRARIKFEFSELSTFINTILKQKKNLNLQNLNITLTEKKNLLFNLNNINFSNYGYNKNKFFGLVFDKEFKFELKEDLSSVIFEIPSIKFITDLNFTNFEKNLIAGDGKIKILNTNLKFNFLYKDRLLKIMNSYFRNKELSFNYKSSITFNPYFEIESNFIIEEINFESFKDLNYTKFLKFKNFIKKINSKNTFILKSKSFYNQIDEFRSNLDIAYGRLNFKKFLKVDDSILNCEGLTNLIDDIPLLEFDCYIFSKDKKKLLKIFSVNYKNKNEIIELKVKGKINTLNNKINFKSIISKNYIASKEDLKYFNNQFEKFLFDKDLFGIFDLKRIKKFILEIS